MAVARPSTLDPGAASASAIATSPIPTTELTTDALPTHELLLNFIKAYVEYRTPTWNSSLNRITTAIERGVNYIIPSRTPTVDKINNDIEETKAIIEAAIDFNSKYKLIFKLREMAKDEHKLFSQTLHALANILILSLGKELQDKIASLKARIKTLETDIEKSIAEKKGMLVEDNNKKINKLLVKLALLGDVAAFNEARQRHLLTYSIPDPKDLKIFNCGDQANRAASLLLQPEFFSWLYSRFQDAIGISLQDFLNYSYRKTDLEDFIQKSFQLKKMSEHPATVEMMKKLDKPKIAANASVPIPLTSAELAKLAEFDAAPPTFPCKKLLGNYLKQYLSVRIPHWKTTAQKIGYSIELAASYLTKRDPIIDQIIKITVSVDEKISAAIDFDSWYKLIFELTNQAKAAKQAKQDKTLPSTSQESLLAETLYALADLVRLGLGKQLEKKIFLLKKEMANLEAKIADSINHQGIGVEDYNKKVNILLLELAELGDISACNKMMVRDLDKMYTLPSASELKSFGCEETANRAGPLVLQQGFSEWLYLRSLKQGKGIRFDEFKEKALQEALAEEAKKERGSTMSSTGTVIHSLNGSGDSAAAAPATPVTVDAPKPESIEAPPAGKSNVIEAAPAPSTSTSPRKR